MKLYLRGNLLSLEWRKQISRQQFMPHLCKNRAPINAKKGDIEISAKNKKDTWVYLGLLFDYRKVHTKFAIKISWILVLTFWIGANKCVWYNQIFYRKKDVGNSIEIQFRFNQLLIYHNNLSCSVEERRSNRIRINRTKDLFSL